MGDNSAYGKPFVEKQLQTLANHLLLTSENIPEIGLYKGKTGICLFFYLYSSYSKTEFYDNSGGELLELIFEQVPAETDISFATGLAGLGWAIEFLSRRKLIDADTDEVLADIDEALLECYTGKSSTADDDSMLQIVPYLLMRESSKPRVEDDACLKILRQLKWLVDLQIQSIFQNRDANYQHRLSIDNLLNVLYHLIANPNAGGNNYAFLLPTLNAVTQINNDNLLAEFTKLTHLLLALQTRVSDPQIHHQFQLIIQLLRNQTAAISNHHGFAAEVNSIAKKTSIDLIYQLPLHLQPEHNGPYQLSDDTFWHGIVENINKHKPGLDGLAGLGLHILNRAS
ncbi:lanthionine synthetase LanC family protein [Mucilaginibacter pedocola]|uniref:Uncharacterized protein n=1 Tax=Mucilaginibacter pedocola TaxID=1792845 RepID=A0A1S9P7W9_9SPHI|nr:lanthionine synthetase LanC family protein [Mucilaginibacter pedocola]OOQ56748.1 hypothetical protein BC343_17310 [Mucilaginibacter pedocola]